MEKAVIFLFLHLVYHVQVSFSFAPNFNQMKLIPLKNSFGHKDHGLEKVDILDPQINLTLTMTGSWPN